jgi:lysozyme family protein
VDFDTAFDRLIGHEGGYSNHPKDPGKETKWGISKRSYPQLNIKTLTREDARLIYHKDFWNRINGDTLYDGVAFQVFDFAVNSGIETAVRYLQRAVGVADDGHWGPISAAAAKKMSESDTIMRLISERQDFQTRLSTWETFGKGWARRNAQNLRYGAIDS